MNYLSRSPVSARPTLSREGGEVLKEQMSWVQIKLSANSAITYLSPEDKNPTSNKQVNKRVHISNLTLTEVMFTGFYNTENRKTRSFKIHFYCGWIGVFACCVLLFLALNGGKFRYAQIFLSKAHLQPSVRYVKYFKTKMYVASEDRNFTKKRKFKKNGPTDGKRHLLMAYSSTRQNFNHSIVISRSLGRICTTSVPGSLIVQLHGDLRINA